jgi:inosine/xanthosine triphosphatase
MKIAVTSENKLKIDAVKKAYSSLNVKIEIVGYKADSKVGEQPINEQTLKGAKNRITDLNSRIEDFDRIISIESGLFEEKGEWIDKAVVVIFNTHTKEENLKYSKGIIFPKNFVEEARKIGFEKITVGTVMEKAGHVKNNKDPHLTITGISRQVYIEETVKELVAEIETNF